MLRRFLVICTLSLLFSFDLGAEWSLDTMLQVKKIATPSLSPDGKNVVYTADGALYLNTDQIVKKGGFPAWSPSGDEIAYLNDGQLFLYDLHGKKSRPLTQLKDKITSFKWKPDGTALAVGVVESETKKIVFNPDKRPLQQLWLVSSDGKELRQLTDERAHFGTCWLNDFFAWSEDGKEIISTKMRAPGLENWMSAELVKIELATGKQTPFISHIAERPVYSPDGKWVAFVKRKADWNRVDDIWVAKAVGGESFALAQTFNRDSILLGGIVGWSQDASKVYVLDYNGTKTELVALPLSGAQPEKIELGFPHVSQAQMGLDQRTLCFVGESLDKPPEVFIYTFDSGEVKQVSTLHSDLPLEQVATTKQISWEGAYGVEIEGLLTYPLGYEEGQKFPLLVIIHGGPAYLFRESFIGAPNFYPLATFASHGFGILRCNIRGSSGYGADFRCANFADWGGEDFQDILRGINLLEQEKCIEKGKIGVMGYSYGGYMTAWAITQTDRFAAASVGGGICNLVSMSGTTDIPTFISGCFGVESWENLDLYLERSPLTHIQKVETPILIQHGTDDRRVPKSQALEFYRALKKRKIESELQFFPETTHSSWSKKALYEAGRANLEWFESHLKTF